MKAGSGATEPGFGALMFADGKVKKRSRLSVEKRTARLRPPFIQPRSVLPLPAVASQEPDVSTWRRSCVSCWIKRWWARLRPPFFSPPVSLICVSVDAKVVP